MREAAGLTAHVKQAVAFSRRRGTQPPFFAADKAERAAASSLRLGPRPPSPAEVSGCAGSRSRRARDPAGQDRSSSSSTAAPVSNCTFLRSRIRSGRQECSTRLGAWSSQRRRSLKPGDATCAQAALALLVGLARDAGARLVPVGTHHKTRSAPRSGGRRGRGGTLRDAVARGHGPLRDCPTWTEWFTRMTEWVGATQDLELNLLYDGLARAANASAAIRCRQALRERSHRDSGSPKPLAGRDRGRVGPLERLVGDVLDLASSTRGASPRVTRRSTWPGCRAGLCGVRRGASRGQSTTRRTSVAAGDRHLRRSRPGDHHEPAANAFRWISNGGASIWRSTRRTARSA